MPNGLSVSSTPIVSAPGARAAALEFLRNLATEVSEDTVDLPCFPDVVIRVRNALADPDAKLEHTVTIVGAEPRLAARLLQTANSAAFNPSGRKLTDLRTAITRLGQQLVQSAAMAFAVQQMKDEASLRSIAGPLSELWKESISVASICQVVARRTKVSPDEAFLTGLLHGIGRLYIMVRSVDKPHLFNHEGDARCMDMVAGWDASIGKAVLENWGFADEMCDAVGDQTAYDRKWRREADLSDVLIASIVLADALEKPEPRTIALEGVTAFHSIGLTAQDCPLILRHAEYQLGSLQDALGC
jgi:HD-like signal output (HDOD) protein